MTISIRGAVLRDAALVLSFIRQLAEYEREPSAVETTLESLATQLAADPAPFECRIAELDGEPAGFALFFHNYSTWRGRRGLYLEDLFVPEPLRGRGVGGALLRDVARIAVERDCARMEWAVLDWNRPAIDFYVAAGARALSEWTVYRLTDAALREFAEGGPGGAAQDRP